jgi:sugar-specific transcriptional regulator TrmB
MANVFPVAFIDWHCEVVVLDVKRPGTFRLVPPDERLPEFRRDYQAMKDMYLSEPPEFSEILADLQQRFNGTVER